METVTWSDIVTQVTTFIASYDVLVFAGAAVGLLMYGLRRFLSSGR